ncbi:hypothetical protein Hanom_Chr09g00817061 [Helianthus anomalus]
MNNVMSAISVNSGLQNGYVHALNKKTPYAEVPLLNQNAEADLNTLVNELLSKIKDALFFAGGESSAQ